MSVSVIRTSLIAAVAVSVATYVAACTASTAYTTNTGRWEAAFCTNNPNIMVVHSCQRQDAYSSCAIGHTLLTGDNGAIYRLRNGNAVIARGCYSQTLANTTVVGTAKAMSTVWYD